MTIKQYILGPVLFVIHILIAINLSAQTCQIEEVPLNDDFKFQTLFNDNNATAVNLSQIRNLPSLWWPLGGKHSTNDARLIFNSPVKNTKYIRQRFSFIEFTGNNKLIFGLLSLGTIQKYPLKMEKLRLQVALENKEDCLSPSMLSWETNNPLSPETKLKFYYVGAVNTTSKKKLAHIEVLFPNGTRIRFVAKADHPKFGISADESLVKLKAVPYGDQHINFRSLMGLIDFDISDTCPELAENKLIVENLTQCLVKQVNTEEAKTNSAASIHLGERDQRWVSRLSFLPPKESGELEEHYISLVSLDYNIKNFQWDKKSRISFHIQMGAEEPELVDIDPDLLPPKKSMGSNISWDKKYQNLILNIDHDRKFIEFEYLEKIIDTKTKNDRELSKYQRIIRPIYGKGKYLYPRAL